MSEPDSTPRRRAPTIDLKAEEVETEPTDSTQNRTEMNAATVDETTARARSGYKGESFRKRARPYVIGALVGVCAAVAVVAGFWLAGLPPPRAPADVSVTAGAKPVATDEISARLDKIQQTLQTPRRPETVASRMTVTEAQMQTLVDSLAALTRRVDEVAATSQTALAQSKAATDGAKTADALNDRLAALESAVKSLSADVAQASSRADDSTVRMTIAAEALRATVERGGSYQAELAAVKALGADESATTALDPFAASGIPSASVLAHELTVLAPTLQRASEPASTNGSFIGRLENSARKLVRITPIDAASTPPAANEDPSTVIARIKADAAREDIAAALADIGRLPDPARALADAWVKKTQARERALGASERIVDAALTALGKPAAQ